MTWNIATSFLGGSEANAILQVTTSLSDSVSFTSTPFFDKPLEMLWFIIQRWSSESTSHCLDGEHVLCVDHSILA